MRPKLAVLLLAGVAALASAVPAAASTWYVSGTITNETAYTAGFPQYETDCPGGAGVKSGNWIIAPPSAIPPGKSVPYKFDAPHFGEGAHMCLAYEILAGEDEERLQTWTITVDDAIAQTPWASCQAYYPIGDAGCVLSVSGANKKVTANFSFEDCGPPGTPCPGAEGECAAAKSQDTPELCQWFSERKNYPGLAGQVLGLGSGHDVVSGLAYEGGALRYSLSRQALVRVLVSKRTRSGLRALPTRERLRGPGAQRTRLRLADGRYRVAAIACHAPKRCSTDVLRVTVP
jgi:hypothetical protein